MVVEVDFPMILPQIGSYQEVNKSTQTQHKVMSLSYRTHNNLLRIIIINSFSSLILSFYNQTYMLEKLPWRQLSMTVTHFFYQEVSLKPLMQECNITNSLSRSLKFLQKNLSEIILMQTSCHKNKRMIDYIFFANQKNSTHQSV